METPEHGFQKAEELIRQNEKEGISLSVDKACRLAGVSRSGYYAWKQRQAAEAENRKKTKEDAVILSLIFRICCTVGYVPGARTMSDIIQKVHGIRAGRKKVSRLMVENNYRYSGKGRKKRDAYKGDATHLHPGCAIQNHVLRDFMKGPRRVILTDITYLFSDIYNKTFYLCTFLDPFTQEVLGWSLSDKMDCSLIQSAYGMMMKNHEKEFEFGHKVYIHSDQGSQYLSTSYQELLENDGFIQSMSRRGNSQDNAPQESFFGKLKDRLGGSMILTRNYEQSKKMVGNYIHEFNHLLPKDSLAGLCPREFYLYCKTGIYPQKEYFGVPAEELHSIEEVIEYRSEMLKKQRKNYKSSTGQSEASRKYRDKTAIEIIEMDIRALHRKARSLCRDLNQDISKLSEVIRVKNAAAKALEWVMANQDNLPDDLNELTNWPKYRELDYCREYSIALSR